MSVEAHALLVCFVAGAVVARSVAVEMEAIDPATGKELAAMRLGYFAPLSDLSARFSKLAPAQIAIQRAVGEFTRLLTPPAQASQTTPAAAAS